jgi:hypothetical protein
MNFYIYTYTDPRNDEIFYVGLGRNRRWKDHLRMIKNGTHKNAHFSNKVKAIITDGDQPRITKIHEGLEKEEAERIERELIAKHGRRDLGTGTLVNGTDGGDGTRGWSDTQRAEQSARRKGKINVIDSGGNRFVVERTDPRWLSGELKGQNAGAKTSSGKMKGFTMARDCDGIIHRVHKDDERFLNGDLVGINRGIKISLETRAKMSASLKGVPRPKPPGFKETMKRVAAEREAKKKLVRSSA